MFLQLQSRYLTVRVPEMCRRGARVLSALAVLVGTAPLPAAAQLVQGRVSNASDGTAVPVALVLLLDSAGVQRAGVLTAEDGTFRVRAPSPGSYSLRVERIGFEIVVSDVLEVARDQVVRVDLGTTPLALDLEGFRVEGKRRCSISPDEGRVVATLWGEAKKALRNQTWTDRMGLVRFRLTEYERELDPVSRVGISERRRTFRWTGQNPILSRPAHELQEQGFVRTEDDGGFAYYAPDASVLLSDAFVDAHCFGLASSPEAPELIGLSFQPLPGRRGSRDIEGTIWLNRADARLRTVEFTYTWSPWIEAAGLAGGSVDFEELANGAWIVRRWWIRMPRMSQRVGPWRGGGSGMLLAGIAEVGGAAEQVDEGRVARTPAGPPGRIQGQVWDSVRARPLAGARVYLQDLQEDGPSTVTDDAGRFTLEGVPAGSYDVSFWHPRLDSLAVSAPGARVSVTSGAASEVALALPSLRTLVGALCRGADAPKESTAVLGVVTAPGSDRRVSGATVSLEWTDYRVVARREFQADVNTLEVSSDARGRWVACGVPPGALIAARARQADTEGAIRRAEVPGGWDLLVLELDLTPVAAASDVLQPPAPCAATDHSGARGSVVGQVRDAATEVPIGPSEVWLVAGDREAASTRSDAAGRFAFCAVEPGAYRVRTAIRGLGSATASLDVVAGDAADVDLRLVGEDTGTRDAALGGRVVRAEDGRPMAGAEVRLDGGAARITAADGSFTFEGLAAGRHAVGAGFLGYADAEGEIILAGGQAMSVEIRLSIRPIELEPIVVEAVRFRRLGLLGEVRRRAESEWGTVLIGNELEASLRTGTLIHALQEHGAAVGSNGGSLIFSRTGCAPQVYIDGVRVTHVSRTAGSRMPGDESPEVEAANAVNLVPRGDIAAVEIYRGPAETPGEFLDSNTACGVILIWTHRGDAIGRRNPGLRQP